LENKQQEGTECTWVIWLEKKSMWNAGLKQEMVTAVDAIHLFLSRLLTETDPVNG